MKIWKTAIFIMLVALMAVTQGCGGAPQNIKAQPTPQNFNNPKLRAKVQEYKDEGSLFTQSQSRDLFRDLKAYRVGDILTVNISESSTASKQATTNLSRESSLSAGVSALFGFQSEIPHKNGVGFSPSSLLGSTISSGFKGSGTTSRQEGMTAQISARVVQVLPNGDLVIRGSREISVNFEKQYIILEGVVRPNDISANNTVLSSYIADARIQYTGNGVLTAEQRPGWLSRLISHVWPF